MGVCQSTNSPEEKVTTVFDNAERILDSDEEDHIEETLQISVNDDLPTKMQLSDFEYIRVIGRGSFGKVLLVRKRDNMKLYAVKILKKSALQNKKQKENVYQERKIMALAHNDFTVKLHYAFQSQTRLYLVMDFIQGGELFIHLRRKKKFSEQETQFYAAEIVVALDLLHEQNIIYRDLKPENILLDEFGHIKLTDFGLSKLDYGTTAYSFCGTPEYVAPEVLYQKGYSHVVDYYSLGAIIYEMLSGQPPYYSKDKREMLRNRCEKPLEIKGNFSPAAQQLLKGLLTKDPIRRLGANGVQEIKKHYFFSSIDWKLARKRQLDPPFVPQILNPEDLSNFATMFTQQPIDETPISKMEEHFENFSYNTHNLTNS